MCFWSLRVALARVSQSAMRLPPISNLKTTIGANALRNLHQEEHRTMARKERNFLTNGDRLDEMSVVPR